MKIDSHQHFWRFGPEYEWIDDSIAQLRRDFLAEHLLPLLADQGYQGCIAVQARQTLEETEFLLDLANDNEFIRGVVGWVDLRGDYSTEMYSNKLKGVRHIVQAEPPGFLDDDKFRNGVSRLPAANLAYDLLIRNHQLEEAIRFVQALPNVKIVLDHIAKPDIRGGQWEQWAGQIREIAKCENLWVKLSGMAFEADWETWTSDTLSPYVDHVLDCFGPKRCMIGSDWPVCLAAGDYRDVMQAIETLLSPTEKEDVLGRTAADFYGLYNDVPGRFASV
ncbi:MAG: amidohydrolase family protein [Fimbriimonadaceae bacterium]